MSTQTSGCQLADGFKHFCGPSAREATQAVVPTFPFLMADGQGDPNTSQAYAQAVEALFSVSYMAKFMVKKGPQALDYAVMPLEGLWWADTVQAAIAEVKRKKSLPALGQLRLESFTEGLCAQVLDVGPFSDEGPMIQKLHAFIQVGPSLAGRRHEIYLSDFPRAAPSRWKTIIRQPMN